MMGYDSWKESGPHEVDEREPNDCPVCGDAPESVSPVCSEECEALVKAAQKKNRIAGLQVAAESALFMARRYVEEAPVQDRRVVECIDQIEIYLREIRALRAA